MSQSEEHVLADHSKILIEWALAAGRSMQSKQTGFVHFCHGDPNDRDHTIPLQENFLFVLALFRSRLVDNIQEGKGLLKRLLAFQNKESGDFPLYLHDYPFCRDPGQGILILASLYWILKQFGHILGGDLKDILEKSAHFLLKTSLDHHFQKNFPYFLNVRLHASQAAFGALWKDECMMKGGLEKLESLAKQQLDGWQRTLHLGELLIGLHMVYPSLKNSPWSLLWGRMEETWHPDLGCYIGPCIREWQFRGEPQPHAYDLFASYCAGKFPDRLKRLDPSHLKGILIHPFQDRFAAHSKQTVVESFLNNQKWVMFKDIDYAWTALEKQLKPNPSIDKTYSPFRLVWGNLSAAHSFVCQGGLYEKVDYRINENTIELIFDLSLMPAVEEANKNCEIEFFIDHQPQLQMFLEGTSSNTFELGQSMEFQSGSQRFSLAFQLLEGNGEFMGHLMRGNRPSQLDLKGENRFNSYDWTLFLRTIRRLGPCKIQATIKLK